MNDLSASNVMTLGTGCGIQSLHVHALMIPLADITAGADKTYTHGITGAHTHSIELTAMDFQTLTSGGTVTKSSENLAGDNMTHSHQVRLVCG
jgi:hypothetical protein